MFVGGLRSLRLVIRALLLLQGTFKLWRKIFLYFMRRWTWFRSLSVQSMQYCPHSRLTGFSAGLCTGSREAERKIQVIRKNLSSCMSQAWWKKEEIDVAFAWDYISFYLSRCIFVEVIEAILKTERVLTPTGFSLSSNLCSSMLRLTRKWLIGEDFVHRISKCGAKLCTMSSSMSNKKGLDVSSCKGTRTWAMKGRINHTSWNQIFKVHECSCKKATWNGAKKVLEQGRISGPVRNETGDFSQATGVRPGWYRCVLHD